MVLYCSDVCQKSSNTIYSHVLEIDTVKDLEQAVRYDHVATKFEGYRRSSKNFISADCSMFDVDNTETDKSTEWITPSDVQKAFPNVPFYVSYSRNHMKQKGQKAPRPKFHVYFPDRVYDGIQEYTELKRRVCQYFTAFDQNAKDAARFFFGVERPSVEFYPGNTLLSNFMKDAYSSEICDSECSGEAPRDQHTVSSEEIIPEGRRNTTLYQYALKVLTRFGNQSGEAYRRYIEKSFKCSPPLDEKEKSTIWNSAAKYYNSTIKTSPNYIAPEQFGLRRTLKPKQFTDVGQADRFAEIYRQRVCYSSATSYLFFNGKVWKESDLKVHGLAQKLVVEQLKEACAQLESAQARENEAVVNRDKNKENFATTEIQEAKRYRKFALAYQHTLRISATLKEAQPMLEVDFEKLDSDGFLLNTPDGTVDLRSKELKRHDPADFCTKITNKSPSGEGKELFEAFLLLRQLNNRIQLSLYFVRAGWSKYAFT